ncbi:MAG TPA: alpha-L-arabinofuranosidase C-terminal domain-containing protein [Acidobacteriaceae bacterium]|nr:alpha-L-arabinofuranosidase C-terminal domain-containing protein [Acidobacteriaceae bacterium]
MSVKRFTGAALLLALAVTAAAQAPAAPAVLTIHAGQPIHTVSPTLYGLMTEEINHSYEGGLYAELVSNPSFRTDWSGLPDWYLVENGSSAASMAADATTGPSAAITCSLKLTVTHADAADTAGVLNAGYWGIAVRPQTTYQGSFWARADSPALGAVTVSLVSDQTGRALATARVSGVSTGWKRFSFALHAGQIEASSANTLHLTVAHPGTLWLSEVSLFPPTYDNRPNGNRVDLMKMLAAMHPAFLRFPGGNYVEGNSIAERFDWKNTIGPLVDRTGHESPWGYWSSDHFGLLEFLDWCEDLHMQPVLAVYAGYSLNGQHVTPGPDLQPYVQSALDEIEYVTGGTDTQWGKVRAEDGHPEPFQLKYVEIGNEDEFDKSGSYNQRFAQFFQAIKAKYPGLQLIATTPVTSVRPDVIDDHFYVRPEKFFDDATHYDRTDRSGPKIFVGEWATLEGTPTPNFGAALSDAAWMTGLERNSDIVIMASYAPLLTNVNPGAMQWAPDLIGYNAMHSYGSPSYYAQVMFSNHIGNQVLGSSLDGAGPRFFYSITGNAAEKRLYLKLVNASSDPQPLEVSFDGGALTGSGELITLSAKSTQATNSIEDPQAIVPVETALHGVGASWRHEMPAYSIQVVQLNLR